MAMSLADIFAGIISGSQWQHAVGAAGNYQAGAQQDAINTILNAIKQVNPQLDTAAHDASYGVLDSANQADGRIADTVSHGQQFMNDAVTNANGYLNPYMSAGADATKTLQDLLAPGGDFNRNFSMNDYQADPGYQFRLDEGNKALQRSAAAHGGVMGGAIMKSLDRYSQGEASQEYQNAFNRFRQQNSDRFDRLSGVSKTGLVAADNAGHNNIAGAQFNGQLGLQGEGLRADLGLKANEYAGNMGWNSALAQGQNTLNGASYQADGQVRIGDINANTVLGMQYGKDQYINAAAKGGQALINGVAGGFSGGHGFNLGQFGQSMGGQFGINVPKFGGSGGYNYGPAGAPPDGTDGGYG
jgi:hypothetical protein